MIFLRTYLFHPFQFYASRGLRAIAYSCVLQRKASSSCSRTLKSGGLFFLLPLLLSLPIQASQSIDLSNDAFVNVSGLKPITSKSQSFRIEGHIHDYYKVDYDQLIRSYGLGINITMSPTRFACTSYADEVAGLIAYGNLSVTLDGRTDLLFRCQRDIPNMRWTLEVWNVDGTGYLWKSLPITNQPDYGSTGASFGKFPGKLGFFRLWTTVLPLNSRPPTTAETADYVDWKFEGNGNDSGGSNNGTVTVGSQPFVTTPGLDAYALPATTGTPPYAPFKPLRAGHANKLLSNSYSMSGTSNGVTCAWQQIDGPSNVLFDDRTACSPTVTGLVFGPYLFRLTVKDTEGNVDTRDLDVGAVAYDDKGVVLYPDERLNDLLGPAKVYTENPWEWADERLTVVANANWKRYEINGGPWFSEPTRKVVNGVPRKGTVYVANGSSTFYGVGTNFLEVFCGGRAGPAITPWYGTYLDMMDPVTGQFWPRAVTSCQSDTEVTAGMWQWGNIPSPGWPWTTYGLANLKTDGKGTVYTSAAAPTKIYGIGTDFKTRICKGTTTPAVATQLVVLQDALTTNKVVASCESETELTIRDAWNTMQIDAPGVSWAWIDRGFDNGAWNTNGTAAPNFYDNVLAEYAFYYRSGWRKARDSARWLADSWLPFYGQISRMNSHTGLYIRNLIDTDEHSWPLFWPRVRTYVNSIGGSNNCTTAPISELREQSYCVEAIALNAKYDPDPVQRAASVAKLQEFVDNWEPEQKAHGEFYNQFASGDTTRTFAFSKGLTIGKLYSGPAITANYCGDTALFNSAGNIAIAKGSQVITGTGTQFLANTGRTILIRGTLDGKPYSQINKLRDASSDTAGRLAHPWPGDTVTEYRLQGNGGQGVAEWIFRMMAVDSNGKAIGPTPTGGSTLGELDTDNWYFCTVVDDSHVRLDKPYTGDTSTNVYRRMVQGGGIPSQPFIHGISGQMMMRAALALDGVDGTRAAKARTMAYKITQYLFDYAAAGHGYGLPYFTSVPMCEPWSTTPNFCTANNGTLHSDRILPSSLRMYTPETMGLFARDYLASPSPEKLARGDTWYNAAFAKPGWTSPFPSDGSYAQLLDEAHYGFSDYLTMKNFGQTFGVGGSYVWPAARLGGPARSIPRTVQVGIVPSENAGSVRAEVIAPSGRRFEVRCEDEQSTCSFMIDEREGDHWYRIRYFSPEGDLRNEEDWKLFRVD